MFSSILKASVVSLLGIAIATAPSSAAGGQCEQNTKADRYLSEHVDGMTAAVIADYYLNHEVLPKADANIQLFWKEFGTSDKDLASLLATWNASAEAKKAVADQTERVEALRQLRATIFAYEGTRESPEKIAALFAAQELSQVGRERVTKQFLAEVSERLENGVSAYAAALQAAQVLQNDVDRVRSPGLALPEPENTYSMWSWDDYVRRKFAVTNVDTLKKMALGKALWNDYLINRISTIKCVGAKLGPDLEETISQVTFPTEGYSNPTFFRKIYEGRTQDMQVSQVGVYLTAFLSMFTNADEGASGCRNVVGEAALLRIAGAGSAEMLDKVMGGFARAHRQGDGFRAGVSTFGGMLLNETSAKADAQLFYNRHGCQSPVASRFFGNISDFAMK